MSSAIFKLTRPGGITRRIQFPNLPNWFALASKIESLYEVPIEKVGVAYIDSDGDQVTISSEDELQDFYALPRKQNETIKLSVQDLGSLRSSTNMSSNRASEIPQGAYRNTFGGPTHDAEFEVDGDWQRLPSSFAGLFGARDALSEPYPHDPESPQHAYIEVLESDANSTAHRDAPSDADNTLDSRFLATITAMNNSKGKARADMQPSVSDDLNSTGSVVVEDDHVKYPVHVLDVGGEGMVEPNSAEVAPAHPGIDSPHSTVTPIVAESTPIATAKATLGADAEDPPLPSVDPDHPAPSLVGDVAALLKTLSTVFSSHPELSERLREITRNTTNGSYWATHREAVSRAAEEIRRSATEETGRATEELRRTTEEEAGRRVADAIGGFMRMFGGDMSAAPQATGGTATADASAQPTTVDYGEAIPPPAGGETPPLSRGFSWATFGPPPPGGLPPFGRPPPGGPHRHRGPPGPHGPFGPPLGPPHRAHWGSPFWAGPPPPPPPPPPHGPEGGPRGGPPGPHGGRHGGHHGGRGGGKRHWGPHGPNDPSFAPPWAESSSGPNPSAAELRERVEIAKQNYKREKELYRRARDERRAGGQNER